MMFGIVTRVVSTSSTCVTQVSPCADSTKVSFDFNEPEETLTTKSYREEFEEEGRRREENRKVIKEKQKQNRYDNSKPNNRKRGR